jgi:DNA-directed RNA polymerase subunit M
MMPTPNGFVKCRKCGKEQSQKTGEETKVKTAKKSKEIAVIEEDVSTLPTIERECVKCGNPTSYFWVLQTRSSDEPPTRFFRCTKCKHTWREYS